MHPQLEAIGRELESATVRADVLAERWSEQDWKKRPSEGEWSAVECLAHLNLTSRSYLPLLDEALDRAGKQKGGMPGRVRRDLIGWLIWKSVRPEAKMKAKTSPQFVPHADEPVARVQADFDELQAALLERLRAADGLPLHRIKVASPFSDRVRYSLFSGFSILAAHEHRHLDQAERALAARTS
jgi:hypothetical protein